MDDMEEMLSAKRKYMELKSNLEDILYYLNNCIENLDIPSENIKKLYNIDDNSSDGNSLVNVRNDLIKKRTTIKSTILVEVNKALKKLQSQIESVE